MLKKLLAWLSVILCHGAVQGADVHTGYGAIPPGGDDLFHQKFAGKITGEYRFDGKKDFPVWQQEARSALLKLLKIDTVLTAPRIPLAPRTLWKRDFDFGSVEKVVLNVEENMEMPVYFCLPENRPAGAIPFFICLQGHSTGMHNAIGVKFQDETTRQINRSSYALELLKRGYGVLCIEQRYMGERSGNPNRKHSCARGALHNLLVGRTLIGMRVFDIDRGIDYLYTRSEVDTGFIGVMGNSGGGTASLYSGAILDRITHVMPSAAFCTFAGSIIFYRHCACNYLPEIMLWGDMAEVAGLCAPKPLVIVNGSTDHIFPLPGAKAEFERLKTIYRAAGAPEKCIHAIGEGGHAFYPAEAFAALEKVL